MSESECYNEKKQFSVVMLSKYAEKLLTKEELINTKD